MMNCSFQNLSSSPSKNILMQERNPTRRICRCRRTNASDWCASLRLQTHETQGKAERCHAAQRSALVGACGPTIFWLASCPKIPSRPIIRQQTKCSKCRWNHIRHVFGRRKHQYRICIIPRVRQHIVRRTIRLLALLAACQRIEVDDRLDLFSVEANVKRSCSFMPYYSFECGSYQTSMDLKVWCANNKPFIFFYITLGTCHEMNLVGRLYQLLVKFIMQSFVIRYIAVLHQYAHVALMVVMVNWWLQSVSTIISVMLISQSSSCNLVILLFLPSGYSH